MLVMMAQKATMVCTSADKRMGATYGIAWSGMRLKEASATVDKGGSCIQAEGGGEVFGADCHQNLRKSRFDGCLLYIYNECRSSGMCGTSSQPRVLSTRLRTDVLS
jgi:hypothetical protein